MICSPSCLRAAEIPSRGVNSRYDFRRHVSLRCGDVASDLERLNRIGTVTRRAQVVGAAEVSKRLRAQVQRVVAPAYRALQRRLDRRAVGESRSDVASGLVKQ